ncbi:hypothetical protein Naga_100623g1 [Nannochloropsis gaditana]|uniref:Uncharacterized protein n=1 Tax=Nannochloropsis gaditana TaxID=72520 RepID=W7TC28_9STRA|nr:hypothetical protein Naga_100623g1 [Nannochloropsis gaditana]
MTHCRARHRAHARVEAILLSPPLNYAQYLPHTSIKRMPPSRGFLQLATMLIVLMVGHSFVPGAVPFTSKSSPPGVRGIANLPRRRTFFPVDVEKSSFASPLQPRHFSRVLLNAAASVADVAPLASALSPSGKERTNPQGERPPEKSRNSSRKKGDFSGSSPANKARKSPTSSKKKAGTDTPDASLAAAAQNIQRLAASGAPPTDRPSLPPTGTKRGRPPQKKSPKRGQQGGPAATRSPRQQRPPSSPVEDEEEVILMQGPKLLRRNFSSNAAPLPPSSAFSTKAMKRQQKMASLQGVIKEEKEGGKQGGRVLFPPKLPPTARLPDPDSSKAKEILQRKEAEAAAALAAIPPPPPTVEDGARPPPEKAKATVSPPPLPKLAEPFPPPPSPPAPPPSATRKSSPSSRKTPSRPASPRKSPKTSNPRPKAANASLPAVEAFITSLPNPASPKTRNGRLAGVSPRPKAPPSSPSSPSPSSRGNATFLAASSSPFASARSSKKMFISRRGEITIPNTGPGSARGLAALLALKDGSGVTPAELKSVVNGCFRRQDWKGLRQLAGSDNGLPLSKDLLDMMVTVTAKAGKSRTARALMDLMILRWGDFGEKGGREGGREGGRGRQEVRRGSRWKGRKGR